LRLGGAHLERSVPPTVSWDIVGTGDYNGDGRDDIMWRNDNGYITNWLGQTQGAFVYNDANAGVLIPTNWATHADQFWV